MPRSNQADLDGGELGGQEFIDHGGDIGAKQIRQAAADRSDMRTRARSQRSARARSAIADWMSTSVGVVTVLLAVGPGAASCVTAADVPTSPGAAG